MSAIHHGHAESQLADDDKISIAIISSAPGEPSAHVDLQIWSKPISTFFAITPAAARTLAEKLIVAADAAERAAQSAAPELVEVAA